MKSKFTCIECPLGCAITAEKKGDEIIVTGNKCNRGKDYAIRELTDPKRILTTTVFVENGIHPLLPVKSDREIPKNLIKKCIGELSKVRAKAPVKYGDVICKNVMGTGANIVSSCSMVRKNE
ncbi:MAG: DUF1667 domain-containing protein [Candidatus Thermoplasmatota archaeon]|nr:DUF1667 domain-containing protein [Candidatus Thermoplasmatota archaeon]